MFDAKKIGKDDDDNKDAKGNGNCVETDCRCVYYSCM